jgi:histidyl-tRNA synthetase
VVSDPLRRSIKAQLRDANKFKARFAIILGESEMENNTVTLKNLDNGEQETVTQKDIIQKMI